MYSARLSVTMKLQYNPASLNPKPEALNPVCPSLGRRALEKGASLHLKKTLNPLNPKTLNPKTLNPKALFSPWPREKILQIKRRVLKAGSLQEVL